MSDDQERSVVYMWYVLVATHHEHIKIGAYLALAGVIALLLSLVLLSIISTLLLHRKPEKSRGRVTCEVLDDPTHPYQYACLQALSGDVQLTQRESEYSEQYAKPFKPGPGISLSNHCLPNDEPHIEIHGGKQYLPHTSVERTVSQTTGELISGYTFEHAHTVLQPREDNSDDDDYEPIGFNEIYENRMDKYGDQTDGEYVSVKTDEH